MHPQVLYFNRFKSALSTNGFMLGAQRSVLTRRQA
jgi:hypothetical protein